MAGKKDIIDQTPLAVGPMAYDVARGVTEAVTRAEGGAVRNGYSGRGRVVKDVVDYAMKLLSGAGEEVAPKIIGTDAAGRPMLDFRGSVVSHFTDPESAADIWSQGYRQVGDGYYGRAVSFTPNREYGRQFGGVETNAVVDPSANILNSGDPAHSEIIQRVLNDRSLAPTNPRPGQKTWDDRFRELGYDGLYDPGAGDLFIYNTTKVKPIPPQKADGGAVDPYAEEVASAKKTLADKAYNDQSWTDWAGDAAENALRTARSILPTALGGEGSVGISDIARGAYEGGKDAVMFPGDVITGKQALFDENGYPLEQAVGRSFNTASTLGGASSVVPRPANSVGVFAGIKSRTADKNALTKAQILEGNGVHEDDIFRETGWFRGPDAKWRYEIPDIGSTVDPSKMGVDLSKSSIYRTAKLSDYISHPELLSAYPELRNMEVNERFGFTTLGTYHPRWEMGTIAPKIIDPSISINLNQLPTAADQRSTLLHEIQHAIQQKEGFAPGTNVSVQPLSTPNPMYKIYEDAVNNDPQMQELQALRSSEEYLKEKAEKDALFKEYSALVSKLDAKEATTGVSTLDEYTKLTNDYWQSLTDMFPLSERAARISKALEERGIPYNPPQQYLDQFGAYQAHAGEIEARNVQDRMNMPREELRERGPWRTQDKRYPYAGQIIDWNDTSWRKGYADGGAVDDDIADALRIANA